MTERWARFDPRVIHALASTMGNHALAFRFLNDFLDLLPRRKYRIVKALRDEDAEAAMDAILSLKITSAMVGAVEAADRARAMQALVANGRLDLAGAEAAELGASIDALVAESPVILASLQPHLSSQSPASER